MEKTAFLFGLILIMILPLSGCKEENTLSTSNGRTVTFINDILEADVWILPDTEANRGTSRWGTSPVRKAGTGTPLQAPLCDPGDNGLYLFRMIDEDGYYYSASGIELKKNWTVRILEKEFRHVVLQITDGTGEPVAEHDVFAAKL